MAANKFEIQLEADELEPEQYNAFKEDAPQIDSHELSRGLSTIVEHTKKIGKLLDL